MEQGRYGGWIPVVNQRRGGGSRGYEDRRGLFTVFVDNIPSSLDAKSLFKLYNKFGVVSDVYIPSKRRIATNSRFGFVRFDCHVASDMAVQKTNGMLVDDKVLAVKYAAHDRSVSSMRRPQAIIEAPNQNRGKGFSSFIGHKSFAEVLSGASNLGDAKASMTVKANEDGHSWLYESVVIRMNSDFSINSIRSALKDIGLDQVVVRKGGGRDVILTFKSKEELQSNIQQIKDRFKDLSQYVLEWRPGIQINQERSVWLKCQGIPLNLWNRSNLHSIGALWGSVLQLEGDLSYPKSFSYFRMKVATTCMELISKTIHLECRGKLHPVFVCEDLCVSPVEFNGASKFGLGDCNSSSKEVSSRVEGNDFSEEECRRKDACDIVAKQVALSVVAVPPSIEVAQRKELTQCNSGETVGTVVEETCSGVEASSPIAVDGKEALSEVGARCSDFSLRCVEQVSATGLCKSLSGSLDGFGPGINLEVALGLPNDEPTVHGPSRLSSDLQGKRAPVKGTLFNVGSIGSGTMRLKDQGPVHCPVSIHNSNRSTKKAGKKKVQMEGFSRFARLYGHQSAAMGRLPSKSVIFRPAVVALAQSELSEGDSSSHSQLLKEAQATVQLGKELGINFCGQEEGMVNKIIELELKDRERFLKDGNGYVD